MSYGVEICSRPIEWRNLDSFRRRVDRAAQDAIALSYYYRTRRSESRAQGRVFYSAIDSEDRGSVRSVRYWASTWRIENGDMFAANGVRRAVFIGVRCLRNAAFPGPGFKSERKGLSVRALRRTCFDRLCNRSGDVAEGLMRRFGQRKFVRR